MEVLPCARVAHIERTKKPYNNDIDYYAKRNALRAAEVWMDEYKSHVYMAWNIPMNVSEVFFLSFLFSALDGRLPQSPSSLRSLLTCSCRHAARRVLRRHQSIEIQNSDFIPLDLHTWSRAAAQRRSGASPSSNQHKEGAPGEGEEPPA